MSEAPRKPFSVRVQVVTPSMARRWLELDAEHNRNRKPTVITRYARDMKANKWPLTGEAIQFDYNGTLIDGKQRLNAVIEAGVPVTFLVAEGVDPDAMVVIDSGTPRTFADALSITHAKNKPAVGAIVRRVLTFSQRNYMGKGASIQPTRTELMDFYHEFMEEFDTAAARGKDAANQKLGNATSAGTAFFLFARLEKDKAHAFFDMVLSGANLKLGHPALTLSRRLAQRQWGTSEQLAGWIRAWNAYRADRTLDNIQLTRKGDLTNANFPLPK
jgi:hypothetical protein